MYLCLKVEEGLTRAASWLMGDLSGHTLNCGVEVVEVWRWGRSITILATDHDEEEEGKC